MKKFPIPVFVLAVFMFLFYHTGLTQTTKVSGKLDAAEEPDIQLGYFDIIAGELNGQTSELDSEGNFQFLIEPDKPRMYYLINSNQRIELFLEQGYDLQVDCDLNDIYASLKITGTGNVPTKYLIDHYFKFEDESRDLRRKSVLRMKDDTPLHYKMYQDSLLQAKLEQLDTYSKRMDSTAFNFFKAQHTYRMYTNLFDYPMMHRYYNNLSEDVELPDSYYDFLQTAKIVTDDFTQISSYTQFVDGYLNFMVKDIHSRTKGPFIDHIVRKYHLSNILLSGEIADIMRAYFINSAFRNSGYDKANILLEHYLLSSSNREYQEVLIRNKNLYKRLEPGNEPPSIELTTLDGSAFNLSDLKGKVVFIDFWASWCGPCIREFPAAREIKDSFKNDDIIFLYVSIDEDENAWRKAVEKHELKGTHVWSKGFGSEVPKSYGVTGIPSYFLIGKDGKMLNNRAPRPSDSRLPEELMKALNQ